jgi:hypothetical protein
MSLLLNCGGTKHEGQEYPFSSTAEDETCGTGMSLLLIKPFLKAQEYRVAQASHP